MECIDCNDEGLVFSGGLHACHCEKGKMHQGPNYFPSDKKKERPYFLPVWGSKSATVAPTPEPEKVIPDKRLPYKDD